jgi:hypothetical protein
LIADRWISHDLWKIARSFFWIPSLCIPLTFRSGEINRNPRKPLSHTRSQLPKRHIAKNICSLQLWSIHCLLCKQYSGNMVFWQVKESIESFRILRQKWSWSAIYLIIRLISWIDYGTLMNSWFAFGQYKVNTKQAGLFHGKIQNFYLFIRPFSPLFIRMNSGAGQVEPNISDFIHLNH